MSDFMSEPSLLLETANQLREAIAKPDWMNKPYPFCWRVKSIWLCNLIDEYATTIGFPYNSAIQRLAEQRLGIPQQSDSGSPLSTLIYNAQKYLTSDKLLTDGYRPLTEAMLEEAFQRGRKIECPGETLLSVRNIDGKLYAMKPRRRKYAVRIEGQPAKIV